jgi:1-acyl-sn-glycerol-3-phosphate acyltransferase
LLLKADIIIPMMNSDAMELEKAGTKSKAFIDIDKVLREKGGKAYPFIPRFMVSYLKRIVHQETMNEILTKYENVYGLDFLHIVLKEYFTVDIEVKNPENIPVHGRYVIACNHPLGGLDGMALMYEIGKKRKDFKFISNDILMELNSLKGLFLPVNKHGRTSTENIRAIDNLYASDELVLVFPAGLVSRKQEGGIIKDLEWQKSFISKAIQHKRDIVPVYIEGRNSRFFYNLARMRKRLGIKFNIEMLYLVDEMFKQADKKMILNFGKPIPYSFFDRTRTPKEWAQWMKEYVYQMGKEI